MTAPDPRGSRGPASASSPVLTALRAIVTGTAVACFYGVAFALLTYPRIRHLATDFWADSGDGFENVWNLWWVRTAVVTLHQSPWHTTYLDHPFGISLHAHALGAFNGFLAIPLATVLGPVATHNLVVIFAFATSGLTAFLLARALTGSAVAGLVAGWLFTFSAYHFAHTGAHLNLVAVQWIPLFLLCWLRLLERPTNGAALGAAVALFAVYLCDYYYFAYSVLAAVLLVAAEAYARRDARFVLRREYRRPLAVFVVASALTSGVLIVAWVRAYLASPFIGGHDPRAVSLDLLAPFIPGGHSRFAAYSAWYWRAAGGNVNENSVYLGWATIALMIAAAGARRETYAVRRLGRWWVLLAVFGVLALGPRLQIVGREVPGLLLPYGWLDTVVPFMRLSGVPIRAFVMVTLAGAVLAAAGFVALWRAGIAARVIAVVLLSVALVETLPGPIPATAPRPASFATTLAAEPDGGALIDVTEPPLPAGVALYFQTIHQKPMAFGHTSRKTRAVAAGEQRLRALVAAGDYRALQCEHGFRWLLADEGLELDPAATVVELWEPGRRGKLHDLWRRFGDCPRAAGSP